MPLAPSPWNADQLAFRHWFAENNLDRALEAMTFSANRTTPRRTLALRQLFWRLGL